MCVLSSLSSIGGKYTLHTFIITITNLRSECRMSIKCFLLVRSFCQFLKRKYTLMFIIYFPRNLNWIDWEKPRTFSSFAFLIYAGNIDNYTLGNLQVTRFAKYWQILCSLGSYICNSNSNCISFNFLQFPLFLFSWKW